MRSISSESVSASSVWGLIEPLGELAEVHSQCVPWAEKMIINAEKYNFCAFFTPFA